MAEKNLVDLNPICEPQTKKGFPFTARRYRQLASEGIVSPVIKGKIDFVDASFALIRYYKKLAEASGIMSLQEQRTENVRLKNELLKIETLLRTGEIIRKDEVKVEFQARIIAVKTGFLALVKVLPPLLVGKDAREISDILKRYFYQLLDRFSRKSGVLRSK